MTLHYKHDRAANMQKYKMFSSNLLYHVDYKTTGYIIDQCNWCLDNLGPRYTEWTYVGGHLWKFRTQEHATLFLLTWS